MKSDWAINGLDLSLREISVKPVVITQSNLNRSNTDGSFTMSNLYSFLSPYETLPIAQEHKYLRKFASFIRKLYVL